MVTNPQRMTGRWMQRLVMGLAALAALPAGAETSATPQRVVSMNLCTDQLAMMLAAPGQLYSVSTMATDPGVSVMQEVAATFVANTGQAEEIFVMQPDLVLAGEYTPAASVDMLERLGIPVVRLPAAASIADVREGMLEMGRILGRVPEAEAMLAQFDADLASMQVGDGPNPATAIYAANGYTTGKYTLSADVMQAAGLDNLAAQLGLEYGGILPLETLVMASPELVLTGYRYAGASRSEEILDHPALAAMPAAQVTIEDRDWICGLPQVARAVATLAASPKSGGGAMSFRALIIALVMLVAVLFAAALLVGPAGLAPGQSLIALIKGDSGAMSLVMREIRLPRAILAVMVGASLGLSGAAMQGYLRNPLAEPGLIGVSAASALGAVIALQTGFAAAFALALPLAALVGALVAVGLILMLAGPRGSSLTLILAGIAISALAGALSSLVLNLSPNPFAANEIVFWMMGSLADRSFAHVWIALPVMAVGWAALATLGPGLNALTLGEDAAASLGVRVVRLRLVLIGGVAASVGAATAVAGAIGFVGLVVPHILRPLVGAQPSRLLLSSALGGAAMVLAADIAVRLVLPDRDLKLGVLMALVGAPIFLHLIYRTGREAA